MLVLCLTSLSLASLASPLLVAHRSFDKWTDILAVNNAFDDYKDVCGGNNKVAVGPDSGTTEAVGGTETSEEDTKQ